MTWIYYDGGETWRFECARLSPPLGALYPTSMRINEQGRLMVHFRTEARFRGLFVESHPGKACGFSTDTIIISHE